MTMIGAVAFILAVIYVLIEFLASVPNFNTRYWGVWLVIGVIVVIIAIGFYYKEFLAMLSQCC